MSKYLIISAQAQRDLKRYKKKNDILYKQISLTLERLVINPFSRELYTHRVKTSKHGQAYSTRVNGDIRIVWRFDENNIVNILALGGHSGKTSVYICF